MSKPTNAAPTGPGPRLVLPVSGGAGFSGVGRPGTEPTKTVHRPVAGGRAWLVYLACGSLGVVAYAASPALGVKTALALTLTGSGLAAAAIGVRRWRPRPILGWTLLTLAVAVWFADWIFWQGYIAAHAGASPPLTSWRNLIFLAVYPVLVGALLRLVWRRERDVGVFVDVAIIASALAAVAWIALTASYLDESREVSGGVRAAQTAFALGDVVLLAGLLRLLVSPGERTAAYRLLLAGGFCCLVSDVAWNWSALLSHSVLGAWTESGWMIFPVAVGAAGLHPSMSSLFAVRAETCTAMQFHRLALLGVATVIAPAILVVQSLTDRLRTDGLFIVLAAGALGLLVILRLVLGLREQQILMAHVESQNHRLLEVDRVKDDFVASVSHELRTPLTSIRGYLELIRDGDGGLTREQQGFLTIVDRNADRLLRVVDDLLLVAAVHAGVLELELEDVDVGDLVGHAVDVARPQATAKSLELGVETVPMRQMRGDRVRLGQIVDNLVSNAIKFTPPGGRVDLYAFPVADRVVLEVCDTGRGMSLEEQEQLFQRFYRVPAGSEQAIHGTGLGLTIVKALVEAHGGAVSVTSVPGQGTTFRVDLPLAVRARI